MNKPIWIKTPAGSAAIEEAQWRMPSRQSPGSMARNAAFLERLNEEFADGYLSDYANALHAAKQLGGEVLTPEPTEEPLDEDEDLPIH